MANKHMKRWSTVLVIRERQMKTMRYIPNRKAKIKNMNNVKHWRRCGVIRILLICWWERKMEISLANLTKLNICLPVTQLLHLDTYPREILKNVQRDFI